MASSQVEVVTMYIGKLAAVNSKTNRESIQVLVTAQGLQGRAQAARESLAARPREEKRER